MTKTVSKVEQYADAFRKLKNCQAELELLDGGIQIKAVVTNPDMIQLCDDTMYIYVNLESAKKIIRLLSIAFGLDAHWNEE